MKTKVVYVLVSSSGDLYTEQLYMSLWSCRRHNPEVETIVLTDRETMSHIDSYPGLKDLVSDFKIREFPRKMSRICRSRILKTTIPESVEGRFLYVDVDTIITGSLDELDNADMEISLVEDRHVKYYSQTGMLREFLRKSYKYYGRIPGLNAKYYNGGALFCKNSSIGKRFFKDWNKNWQHYISSSKDFLDQTALFETTQQYKDYVSPLGHPYNVQVGAYKNPYKDTGKILHFYNSIVGVYFKTLHPFFDQNYYNLIKESVDLPKIVKEDIINCKKLFRYDFFNERFRFIPTPIIDIYRHLRWKTFYNISRPFTYFYFLFKYRIKRKNLE